MPVFDNATLSDLSVCICKQRLVCLSVFFFLQNRKRVRTSCIIKKTSRKNTQLQSTDVYLAVVLRALLKKVFCQVLYTFVDLKSLIISALFIACFCLAWCEMEDVPIFFTQYIRVLFCHKSFSKPLLCFACHSCDYFGVKFRGNNSRMKDREAERKCNSAILWRRIKTRKQLYQFQSIKCAAGKTVVWMLFSTSDLYFCLDYFPLTMLSCYYLTRQDLLDYCCITSTGEHHSRPFLYIHFKWASNYDKSLPKLSLRWSRIPGDSES